MLDTQQATLLATQQVAAMATQLANAAAPQPVDAVAIQPVNNPHLDRGASWLKDFRRYNPVLLSVQRKIPQRLRCGLQTWKRPLNQ